MNRTHRSTVLLAETLLAGCAFATAAATQSPSALIEQLRSEESRAEAMSQLYARRAEVGTQLAEALEDCEPNDSGYVVALSHTIALVGADAVDALDPVLDLLASAKGDTVPALTRAWVALSPYAPTPQNRKIHELLFEPTMDDAIRFRLHTQRYARESVRTVTDVAGLIRELRQNKIFAREVLAERLERLGPAASEAEPSLIAVLRDRTTRPNGWDQVRQNGLVVPQHDGFRWRAGLALVAIAPKSEAIALAHGAVAAGHPDPATRRRALRQLAGMGPAAKAAMPDLLAIFERGEDALMSDGLQVLGMMGPDASDAYSAVVALTTHADPRVQRRAQSVRRQLQAMAPDAEKRYREEVSAEAERDKQRAAVAAALRADVAEEDAIRITLENGGVAAAELTRHLASPTPEIAVRAGKMLERLPPEILATAAPELVAWYVENRQDGAAHDLLEQVGYRLPKASRELLRPVVAEQHSTSWTSNSFSSHSGGGPITASQRLNHALLGMGYDSKLSSLIKGTTDTNPFRREAAVRVLQDLVQGDPKLATPELVAACGNARRSDHKGPAEFEDKGLFNNNNKKKQEFERTQEVRGLATKILETLVKHGSRTIQKQAKKEIQDY